MIKKDILRFALLISDGQATTFKKNLNKLIKLVLFNCYGKSMTINSIEKSIKDNYSLNFSDLEIKDVIDNDRTNGFICIKDAKDSFNNSYTISPAEFEKMKKKEVIYEIDGIISRFISIYNNCIYDLHKLKDLIYTYLYEVFNTDIETVLALMNYQGEKIANNQLNDNYDNEEKLWINIFLNWNDIEKNKFIYNTTSSCFEYCMMTVKKDNSSFAHIFNGKEFYLDSNIIFRLAGFNNRDRCEVVKSFLEKCCDCGIKIKYTNFTKFEIDSTLSYHVSSLQKLLSQQNPISVDAIKCLSSKYSNLDFYSNYVEWTKMPRNKVGDYEAFLKYLKKNVSNYLDKMQFVKIDSYEKKIKNDDFKSLCDEFTAYKNKRYKDTYEGSIKVDVENYLYMKQLDNSLNSNSFLDKKQFFITADHTYIDWASEKTPGAIPTFVLPSVWYSIMLKYKGRTDNDYTAFCQFLNMRISEPDDGLDDKKKEMLKYILSINETKEIKEEIIFDINQRLENSQTKIEDAQSFVETSLANVIDNKVHQAVKENTNMYEEKINDLEKSVFKNNDKAIVESKKEGFDEGFQQAIYLQANKKATTHKVIRIVTIIIAVISILSLIALLIINSIVGDKTTSQILSYIDENQTLFNFIAGGLSTIGILLSALFKVVNFLPTDVNLIYDKLLIKARNKLKKS